MDRILLLKSFGCINSAGPFLHHDDEIAPFGRQVIEAVREKEKQGKGNDEAYGSILKGYVYRERKTGKQTVA